MFDRLRLSNIKEFILQIIRFDVIGEFDVENQESCSYDRLEYYNDRLENRWNYHRYCNCFPRPFYSSRNRAYFLFRSDGSITGTGFNISYTSGSLQEFGLAPVPLQYETVYDEGDKKFKEETVSEQIEHQTNF